MKRLIMIILFIGIIFSLSAQAPITRFAVVDLNRVAAAFADRSPDAQAFNEKRDKIQAEIDKQNKELQELNARLEEARVNENPNQIKTLENQIKSKTQAIETYIKNNFAALDKERDRLLKNEAFMNQILTLIRTVAESEGCSMVFSKEESSGILWYSLSVDITNKVIERIRRR
ncbi:MAG: OmpH family outer membrane protein [Treponema sp.]|nr:OmpH family outer membrane protein [Treponema sp.]